MKKIILWITLILSQIHIAVSDEIITEIQENWNKIQSMSGEFHQNDGEGNISTGNFYFVKPYQSKFQYNNKAEIIITNENLMRIVDQEGYQIDSYVISNSILKHLLSSEIDILDQFDVIQLDRSEDNYEILLKVKNDNSDNQINLTFDSASLDLKKWQILDEFGNKTVLEFTKIKKNIFISQKLFVVKYKQN